MRATLTNAQRIALRAAANDADAAGLDKLARRLRSLADEGQSGTVTGTRIRNEIRAAFEEARHKARILGSVVLSLAARRK